MHHRSLQMRSGVVGIADNIDSIGIATKGVVEKLGRADGAIRRLARRRDVENGAYLAAAARTFSSSPFMTKELAKPSERPDPDGHSAAEQ
jgi:hypothetical protein